MSILSTNAFCLENHHRPVAEGPSLEIQKFMNVSTTRLLKHLEWRFTQQETEINVTS